MQQRVLIGGGALIATLSLVAATVVGWVWYRVEHRPTFTVTALDKKQKPLPTAPTTTTAGRGPTTTSSSTTTTAAPPSLFPAPLVPPRSLTDGTNFLLVGIDSAAGLGAGDPVLNDRGDSGNTDTMMILRVDNTTGQISLVSVMRDLYVHIADSNTFDRINAAREYKNGRDRLTKTIRDTLGVEIHHYIEVNFRAFKNIVNDLGGVSMTYSKRTRDLNTGFDGDVGCNVLDGSMALAYVRSRHMESLGSDGAWHEDLSADYGRIARQQRFLINVAAAMTGGGAISPGTALGLVDTLTSDVSMDKSLSTDELVSFAVTMARIGINNVHTYSLPMTGIRLPNRQDVLLVDMPQAQDVLNIFRGQVLPGAARVKAYGSAQPYTAAAVTIDSSTATASTSAPVTVDSTAPTSAPATTTPAIEPSSAVHC